MSYLFVSIYYYSEDIGNLICDSHILASSQFNKFGCNKLIGEKCIYCI